MRMYSEALQISGVLKNIMQLHIKDYDFILKLKTKI